MTSEILEDSIDSLGWAGKSRQLYLNREELFKSALKLNLCIIFP